MGEFAVIDFETYYSKSVSTSELGPIAYAAHPEGDIYLVSVVVADERGVPSRRYVGHPTQFNWRSIEGLDWVSHNAAFDRAMYDHLAHKGLIPKIQYRWYCSADLASYTCQRRALADAYEVLTGQKLSKAVRVAAKGVRWSEMTPDQQRIMQQYCITDSEVTAQIWAAWSPHWPEPERRLSQLTIEQAHSGVHINWERLRLYKQQIADALERTVKQLPWVKEGFAPTSPRAFLWQCEKDGLAKPVIKRHDPEGYVEWEAQHIHVPWVRAMIGHRILTMTLRSLERIEARSLNGIFYFDLLYFGAHTGRWAGAGGYNMQNIRKWPLVLNEEGLLEVRKDRLAEVQQLWSDAGQAPAWATAVFDIRSLFIPAPGKKFVIVDLAQIEPRVLAWCSGQHELLRRMQAGESIYTAFARTSLGWQGEGELKQADKRLYALVKAQVLGLGYGCGAQKFVQVAKALAGVDLTEGAPASNRLAIAERIIKQYRSSNPEVIRFWNKMQRLLIGAIGRNLELELPSWRALKYENVHYEHVKDKHRMGQEVVGFVGGVKTRLYGGKLTENYVQATARDVFAECLLRISEEKPGRCVWTTHDEAIIEVDDDSPERLECIKRCMTTPPKWLNIPLAADLTVSTEYCK